MSKNCFISKLNASIQNGGWPTFNTLILDYKANGSSCLLTVGAKGGDLDLDFAAQVKVSGGTVYFTHSKVPDGTRKVYVIGEEILSTDRFLTISNANCIEMLYAIKASTANTTASLDFNPLHQYNGVESLQYIEGITALGGINVPLLPAKALGIFSDANPNFIPSGVQRLETRGIENNIYRPFVRVDIIPSSVYFVIARIKGNIDNLVNLRWIAIGSTDTTGDIATFVENARLAGRTEGHLILSSFFRGNSYIKYNGEAISDSVTVFPHSYGTSAFVVEWNASTITFPTQEPDYFDSETQMSLYYWNPIE